MGAAPPRRKLPAGAERKASPRGRASHKEKKAHSHSPLGPASCGSRAPAANAISCRRRAKSFAPRSGLPQKTNAHGHSLLGPASCGSRAPAAKANSLPAQSEKLRPEVGPPTKKAHSHSLYGPASPHGPAFVGAAPPRRKQTLCRRRAKSFAPRSGLPQKTNAHGHSLHGHTPAGPELNLQDKMHAQLHRIPV